MMMSFRNMPSPEAYSAEYRILAPALISTRLIHVAKACKPLYFRNSVSRQRSFLGTKKPKVGHQEPNATAIITEPAKRYYYLFSKSGFTATVRTQAQLDGVKLVGLDELFMVD